MFNRIATAVFLIGFCFVVPAPAGADNLSDWSDRVNKNWDKMDTDKIKRNLDNMRQPGEIQKPGQLQKPGEIQKAGEIQVPRGLKAVKVVDDKCRHRLLVGSDTLFTFDRDTLTSDAEVTLKVVGPMLAKLGSHPVVVEGHTDGLGGDGYNQGLSERRAQRVRSWLVEHHFAPAQATAAGYGKRRPVTANKRADGSDYPQGRQQNRRVEIVVDTCTPLGAGSSEEN